MAAVEVNNKLFVTGGYNGGSLSSTEFISSEGMVTAGPDLPSPCGDHCMTKLPSGNVIIIGGSPSDSVGKSVIEFNPITNSYNDLPSLISARQDLACAVFYSPFHNGRPVLLAAGGLFETTSELLDYTQPNAKWTQSKSNFFISTSL